MKCIKIPHTHTKFSRDWLLIIPSRNIQMLHFVIFEMKNCTYAPHVCMT